MVVEAASFVFSVGVLVDAVVRVVEEVVVLLWPDKRLERQADAFK